MAKVNSLNNNSSTFTVDNALTVTSGGLTITAGDTTITPIKSTAASGVVTVNDSGVLSEVETGAAGTVFVGTATTPKFLTAGTSGYVLTSQGAGSDPQWAAAGGGGITWTEVTGTTQAMVADNGYICNNAAQVVCTLPSTCAVGKTLRLCGKGDGGWKLAQNASQYIKFGLVSTTAGTGGYLESTNVYDTVELLCITADVGFCVLSTLGNLTVV